MAEVAAEQTVPDGGNVSTPGYDPNDHPESQLAPIQMQSVQTAPTPDVPRISPRLARKAKEAGISEALIARLDAESLDEMVDAIMERNHQVREERLRADTLRAIRELPPAGTNGVTTVPTPAPVATPPEDDLGVDLSEVHPSIAAAFKKLASANSELKRAQGESIQREVQRVAQTNSDTIDEAFESLGADYESIFGKGTVADIGTQGMEFKRRMAVINATGIDLSKQPTPKQLRNAIIEAAKGLFPVAKAPAQAPVDPYQAAQNNGVSAPAGAGNVSIPQQPRQTPARDPVTGKFLTAEERRIQEQAREAEQNWLNAGLSRPTHVNGANEPAGREKAINNVAAILKERGSPPPGSELAGDAQMDDFPQ